MNIVNLSSYESALAFSNNALEKYNSDIKTSIPKKIIL